MRKMTELTNLSLPPLLFLPTLLPLFPIPFITKICLLLLYLEGRDDLDLSAL